MERLYEYLRHTVSTFRLRLCCCFAPLRPGVLFLGYCNLLLATVQLIGVASSSTLPLLGDVQAAVLDDDASPTVAVLVPAVDLAFNVLLVAAMHRNDAVLLRAYIWCGVAAMASALVAYSLVLNALSALTITRIVFSLVYQAYLILLVRSAIVEIKLNKTAEQNYLYYDKTREAVTLRPGSPDGAATLHIVHELKADPLSSANTLQRARTPVTPANTLPRGTDAVTDPVEPPVTITVTPPSTTEAHITVTPPATTETQPAPTDKTNEGQKPSEVRKYTSVYSFGRPLTSSPSPSKDVSSVATEKNILPTNAKGVTSATTQKTPSLSTPTKGSTDATAQKTSFAPSSTTPDSKATNSEEPAKDSAKTTDAAAEGDVKPADVPPKKKRGLFRRAPKESKESKKDDKQ